VAENQHPPDNNRIYTSLRQIILWLIHLFYPRIEIQGRGNLPPGGSIVFVLNHPNGLLDAALLMIGLKRHVSFLGKSTLFVYPILGILIKAFGALPIYLRREDGMWGGPKGDAKERNEETFARCRKLLRDGGSMALFPEGTTHSEPELLPLKTGTARIALGAEAESDWSAGVQIVPVGLWYEQKTRFRSSALVVVGQPFTLSDYADAYAADPDQAVDSVTERIRDGLDHVVLQAENSDLLAAIPLLAAWTAPNGKSLSLVEEHEWTAKVLTAFKELRRNDPARLETIALRAQRLASALSRLDINDPWMLETPQPRRSKAAPLVAFTALAFPFAMLGYVMSYPPYRLAGPTAGLIAGKNKTLVGTLKLINGIILTLIAWILEARAISRRFGRVWGAILLIAALPLAYVALLWGENAIELRELIVGNWLSIKDRELADLLVAERRALAQEVLDAVQASSGGESA